MLNFYKSLLNAEHLNNLYDEYFVEVGVSKESIAVELGKLNKAINRTKEAAKVEKSDCNLQNPSFMSYDVENCAEIWSVRKAIMEGAKFDDIEYKCVFNADGKYAKPCANCQRTFRNLKNSGLEDEWYVK